MATLVFLRDGWFPLVIRDTPAERGRDLDSLEAADRGDLTELVVVFGDAQRRAFVQALGISDRVLRDRTAEQVIAGARERLEERARHRTAAWEGLMLVADALRRIAFDRFGEVRSSLEREAGGLLAGATFFVDQAADGDERSHYFRQQIVETARHADYYANLSDYRAWVRLVLRADDQAEILVSFHVPGGVFRGILACSACFFRREPTPEDSRQVVGLTPLSTEIFQLNYREAEAAAAGRFRDWLEDVLVAGLEIWRRGL